MIGFKLRVGILRRKRVVLGWVGGPVILVALLFGYEAAFRSGLDHLPEKSCDGAIDRATAKEILPVSRTAEESSKRGSVGAGRILSDYVFFCSIRTSGGSIVSGEASIAASTEKSWRNYFESENLGKEISVSRGVVRVLSRPTVSNIYIPCTPVGHKSSESPEPYGLLVESRVIGDSRAKGMDLREKLTDFTYQLAKHSFDLVKCQETVKLPRELPRVSEVATKR